VVGYGTSEFPAFFTRHSGCQAHCRIDSITECALVHPYLENATYTPGTVFCVYACIQTAARHGREHHDLV
jgi:pseudouridine-5'-phosphate glycosidase